MNTFLKIINCCFQEESNTEKNNYEMEVPIINDNEKDIDIHKEIHNNKIEKGIEMEIENNRQKLHVKERNDSMVNDSSHLITNDNNNTIMNNTLNNLNNTLTNVNNALNNVNTTLNNVNNTLNNTNNILNNSNNSNNINNILNTTNNITNNNILIENLSNKNIINNNFNNNKSVEKAKNYKIPNLTPLKKRIIYSNSISHNYMNIKKAINNNFESKKNFGSIISKSKKSRNNISNNGSILTLNNLILTNQIQNTQEEKINEIGSKLLVSGELIFWKELIISTNGIKYSLRKEKNDHVFFGVKNILNKAGESYNDLIINFFYQDQDKNIIETKTGRVFEIFYNKKIKEYILHFLHPNLILYSKINNFVYFIIGKDYYFLLGNIFVSIIVKKTSPIERTITMQVEVENDKPLEYSFNQNQVPIKIGRNKSEVNIFNSSISKNHGIIEYSKNMETFYYKDLGSTNGSTLIIKDGDILKIKGEMNFKLENVPFKIQEIP